jgi:hypothetical protein
MKCCECDKPIEDEPECCEECGKPLCEECCPMCLECAVVYVACAHEYGIFGDWPVHN